MERDGGLSIPTVRRETGGNPYGGLQYSAEMIDKEKLAKVEGLITYYEIKEATSFELALWKVRLGQVEDANGNRNAHRVEVPGPVKDTILQYLR